MPNNRSKIGRFHDTEEFKKEIISNYLPRLLRNEVTIEEMEHELNTSIRTIDSVIKEYFKEQENEDGLNEYNSAKKKNIGASQEKREEAAKAREELGEFKFVCKEKFVILSEEEQEKQIEMRVRKANSDKKSTMSSQSAKKQIQAVREYFSSKNDESQGIINFSEEDIKMILFLYPAIGKRKGDTLDEKIDVVKSYKQTGEKVTYGMIKKYPNLLGYGADRLKKQMDLLEKENLLDYVIDTPKGFMMGVDTMYALIQYAKSERDTQNLDGVTRSSIFMSGAALQSKSKITLGKLKKLYPYEEKDKEIDKCKVNPAAIGLLATTEVDVPMIQESAEILEQCTKGKLIGGVR